MTDTLIEIRVFPSGDIAWAEDPESAIVAAKTLCEDDLVARPYLGRERSVAFFVDDVIVRHVPERELWKVVI